MTVVRDYALPAYLGKDALVVVSSYSGDTEEALSALRDALARGARVACIASGGKLLEEARRRSAPYVAIPGGLPPRAGLGYSFSALLALASRIGLCPDPEAELAGCADLLENLAGAYSSLDRASNPALALAEALRGLVPVIYGGPALEAVAVRWKNQFCENSKQIAFAGLLPEANHNEVMGWGEATKGIRAGIVVLRTADDHPAVARSLGLVRDVIAPGASFIGEFWGDGSSLLCRMFSLILLGDYASAYLALARGVDPTPIVAIDRIKAWLKEGREKG